MNGDALMRYTFVRFAVAAALASLVCEPAAAQSPTQGACFDIIRGSADGQAAGAFLLNRCNGQTWILMRSQRGGANRGRTVTYRWTRVPSEPTPEERSPAPVGAAPVGAAPVGAAPVGAGAAPVGAAPV